MRDNRFWPESVTTRELVTTTGGVLIWPGWGPEADFDDEYRKAMRLAQRNTGAIKAKSGKKDGKTL